MGRILVVDTDEAFARRAAGSLSDMGHRASVRTTTEGAVDLLGREHFDVLVIAMLLGTERSVPLVEWVLRTHSPTRFVAIGEATTVADCRAMLRLGAVDLVPRKADREEIVAAVERALECDGGWRCDLHGVALLDLLQALHHARRSARLVISGHLPGVIDMSEGEIVHATHGDLVGERALASLVTMGNGRVATSPYRSGQQTVRGAFEPLMLALLQQLDEGIEAHLVSRSPSTRPPSTLAPAFAAAMRRASIAPPSRAVGSSVFPAVDATCGAVVRSIDGALVCGVVDLVSGTLLGLNGSVGHCLEGEPQRLLAAAELLRQARGGSPGDADASSAGSIESIHLATDHESQFMRSIRGGSAAVVLFTRRGVDVGWGWSQLASWLPVVESVVP